MRNIWTIAKREYDTYFNSPLAYVVAFSILLPMGIYFALIMFVSSQQAMMGGLFSLGGAALGGWAKGGFGGLG